MKNLENILSNSKEKFVPSCFQDHHYITSAKELGGWVWKMSIIADFQNFVYADLVGGSEKSP